MPNPNFPFGLEPVSFMSGAPYNGAVRTYYVPASNATALFLGDPVIGVPNSSDGNGIQSIQVASAGTGNLILGSFRGITNNAGQPVITLLQNQPVYLPAGQAAYVYVSDDPHLLYAVKDDGAGAGPGLPSGAPGRNVNLVAGAGNTIYGTSGWMLGSASLATTAGLQMRVIEFMQRQNNTIGPNGLWLCKINDGIHSWTQGVGALMSAADLNAKGNDMKDEVAQAFHMKTAEMLAKEAAEQAAKAQEGARGNGGTPPPQSTQYQPPPQSY